MMVDELSGKEAGTVTGVNPAEPSSDILMARRMQMNPTGRRISKSYDKIGAECEYHAVQKNHKNG
jgi:hypothetical protein